jgi:hypothetical protein
MPYKEACMARTVRSSRRPRPLSRGDETSGIKTILYPVKDLARAKAPGPVCYWQVDDINESLK